jgi:hypothetical protein
MSLKNKNKKSIFHPETTLKLNMEVSFELRGGN